VHPVIAICDTDGHPPEPPHGKERTMPQHRINPWKWQDPLFFSQAIVMTEGSKVLYCSGQTSVDADGKVLHAGNMAAQIAQAFTNLETVLAASGFNLSQVVRLNYYTTDMQAFNAAYAEVAKRLGPAGLQPAGTLLGVACLAAPDLMVEIEATAVQ
jgi:enamine deaminase RidA (YjgF/YER057c/UK114 family)